MQYVLSSYTNAVKELLCTLFIQVHRLPILCSISKVNRQNKEMLNFNENNKCIYICLLIQEYSQILYPLH